MKRATLEKLQVAARDGQCRLFYLDEAGFCGSPPVQRSWSPRGLPHAIEPNHHCRRNVLGALNFAENSLIYAASARTVKGPDIVTFLDGLVTQGDGRPTVIVLDNASIHHSIDQDTYHAIVRGYAERYGLDLPSDRLKADAGEWSITRGSRSGRVAWQFIQDLAGRLGKPLE